jgi:hypothetical protein
LNLDNGRLLRPTEIDQAVALDWLRCSLDLGWVRAISPAVRKIVDEYPGHGYALVPADAEPGRLLKPKVGGVTNTDSARRSLGRQLEGALVVADGPTGTRTVVFAIGSDDELRAPVIQRVPVDASMFDLDGGNIDLLLHVVDGYVRELEAYRVDGKPIEREELDGPVTLVNRHPWS